MKIIEIVLLLILLPSVSVQFSAGCRAFSDLRGRRMAVQKSVSRDAFIACSFEKLMEKCDCSAPDIEEWISMCNSLWKLDSISVVTEGIKDRKKLVSCKWRCDGKDVVVRAISEASQL